MGSIDTICPGEAFQRPEKASQKPEEVFQGPEEASQTSEEGLVAVRLIESPSSRSRSRW